MRRGGAEGVTTVSSKVSVSPPPPPSSQPDTSSLFLTRYWRASLRKSPQKRKERTRTRAARRRRESGKPEETRGPPGTDDRVVLMFQIIDDGDYPREKEENQRLLDNDLSPGLTPLLSSPTSHWAATEIRPGIVFQISDIAFNFIHISKPLGWHRNPTFPGFFNYKLSFISKSVLSKKGSKRGGG